MKKKIEIKIIQILFINLTSQNLFSKMPNACSFCGAFTHNILMCNHRAIDIYYNQLKMTFMDILNQNLTELQRKGRFISQLMRRYCVRELKAVAVKYTGMRAYGNKALIIEKLWIYFSENIQVIATNDDWVSVSHTEEEPVTWLIDRTPSPIEYYNIIYPLINTTNAYESAADEFISFVTNLLPQFEAEAVSKKFNIVPLLLCRETQEELQSEQECSICYDKTKLEDSVTLNCQHKFCHVCVKQTLLSCKRGTPTCALCRVAMEIFIVKKQETYDSVAELCKFRLI